MRPALFLDRDGVINVEKNYVHRIEDFEFMPGIFELCRFAQNLGLAIVVVTNQAGIGRGYYSEDTFLKLMHWMRGRFAEQGIQIAKTYYCPCHPEHGKGDYKQESSDRKPNPGMLLRAKDELEIDLNRSIMIGDKESDMIAAYRADIGIRILLDTIGENADSSKATRVVGDLIAAATYLAIQFQ